MLLRPEQRKLSKERMLKLNGKLNLSKHKKLLMLHSLPTSIRLSNWKDIFQADLALLVVLDHMKLDFDGDENGL